jgi:toxin CcdB
MPRLDVHRMPGDGASGYLLNVQADLLSDLATRVVVPLLPLDAAIKPIKDLNPVFVVGEDRYILITQAIASISTTELKQAVANLSYHHDEITRALDVLGPKPIKKVANRAVC